MARNRRRKNTDYEQQRWDLARKVRAVMFRDGGLERACANWRRGLATSVSTLKALLRGSRPASPSAVLREPANRGRSVPRQGASIPTDPGPAGGSLAGYVAGHAPGVVRHGVGNLEGALAGHWAGLERVRGRTYVKLVLGRCCSRSSNCCAHPHPARAGCVRCDERFAALEFLSRRSCSPVPPGLAPRGRKLAGRSTWTRSSSATSTRSSPPTRARAAKAGRS